MECSKIKHPTKRINKCSKRDYNPTANRSKKSSIKQKSKHQNQRKFKEKQNFFEPKGLAF